MVELQPITSPVPLKLKNVFLQGRWRHVILLTYSFDLPFFESYLLRLLVDAGANMVTVVADAAWLSERLPKWLESGDVREAGRSYTLSAVRVPNVFHPKLVLAADETSGTVLLGSGNMSAYGLATGGELFTLVDWHDAQVPSIAQEAWRTCRDLSQTIAIDPLFEQRVEAMGRLVPALALKPSLSCLRHNLVEPLLDQFVASVGGQTVAELLLWSPFTDRPLEALRILIDRLNPKKVTLAIQPGLTGIDGQRLTEIASARDGIDWRFVELRQNENLLGTGRQLIHAKGILALLDSGEELLLAGSPNLSTPALLKTVSEGNFEITSIQHGRELYQSLFAETGPICLGAAVDLATVSWSHEPSVASIREEHSEVELLGARWNGAVLELKVRGNCPQAAEILIDGRHRLPVQSVNGSLQSEVPPGVTAIGVELIWEGGRSGPVIVADLPRLDALGRSSESRAHTPLSTLDYGGDSDLLVLLDELAQLAIITHADIDRMMRGRSGLSEREEADEVAGSADMHDLEDIDFETVRQHPRGRVYESIRNDFFDAPRLQLHLAEVVQQFDMLRERQLLRVVKPIVTGDDSKDDDPELADEPAREVRRWPVSRRVRVRVLNRVRRYVTGVGDPRFWQLISPQWMAKNYVLFLDFLDRLWRRAGDPATLILPRDDIAVLSLDLLSAFWGSDERDGYWAHLSEDEALEVALLLEEHKSIALTVAIAIRLLSISGEAGRIAPFVVSALVRACNQLGLITSSAAEEALVYLDQQEREPASVVMQLGATNGYFTWDRFLYLLARRHHVRKIVLENRGFATGEAMVIDASGRLEDHPAPLAVLADWIDAATKRGSTRHIFQLIWNSSDLVIYNSEKRVLRRSYGIVEARWSAPHEIGRNIQLDELRRWNGRDSDTNDFHGRAG